MRASLPTRVLLVVFAVVSGAVFGVAGTIAHAYTLGWMPIGLVLALGGCAALLIGLRLLGEHRWVAWVAGLAMLAMLFVFSGRGPGGSVVVPQAAPGEFPLGIVWTYALTGVVLLVGAWPDLSRLRRSAPSPAGDGHAGASEDGAPGTRRIEP
ncbi:histidinol dehydrogenase [Microbacterium marinilacus]|uniref:Histidinol dehydrogenase n=1 Tax=Microbacterium marinilacus TaxID=415209 RepID=A0ABP7B6I4_9MICO|nr:histidinol dehydrogenase [Microbacterium marinilacus]MBY0687496.1 histidinol dehydrogenase [Microbacterium marinilacus]